MWEPSSCITRKCKVILKKIECYVIEKKKKKKKKNEEIENFGVSVGVEFATWI